MQTVKAFTNMRIAMDLVNWLRKVAQRENRSITRQLDHILRQEMARDTNR